MPKSSSKKSYKYGGSIPPSGPTVTPDPPDPPADKPKPAGRAAIDKKPTKPIPGRSPGPRIR